MKFKTWFEETSNENISYLLDPIGKIPMIGYESIDKRTSPEIAIYKSPHGSYRLIYHINGTPASALQLVTSDGINAHVANAYTAPEARRKHLATQLLNKAKTMFKNVTFSNHRSDDGANWVNSVEKI